MKTSTKRLTALAAVLIASAAFIPGAQAAYPEKPVSVIVPFGAGGGFDQMVRALMPKVEKILGVPVAIKNNPGSGGRRGAIVVHKSKPDGYTIGLTFFTPFLVDEYVHNKKPAIDYRKFEVIYKTSHSRHFLYVAKGGKFQSLKDFESAQRPIKFVTTGIGSSSWLAAEALAVQVGYKTQFLSGYKTLSAAALGVGRGDADAGFGAIHHFGGMSEHVKPLVYMGIKREAHYPDVPTAAELGYPKSKALGGIHVFSAPPGTPKDRVEVLREALRKASRDPEFIAWGKETATDIEPTEPAGVWKEVDETVELFKLLKIKK